MSLCQAQSFSIKRVLFVILPQFLLVFLVIGFASWNKILEEHTVINDLYVEDEECPEASYADAVHVVIADKFLTVGTKFGASPPSLTAKNPVVISEHHHPKMLKTL